MKQRDYKALPARDYTSLSPRMHVAGSRHREVRHDYNIIFQSSTSSFLFLEVR